jgi:hypothetical protein
MSELNDNGESQPLAFLKFWTDSFSRLGQAAFCLSPDATPPEQARQIRAGVFRAMAEAWDDMLRSPEFLKSLKELMDQGIAFQKFNNGLMAKARRDLGGVGPEDVDALAAATRRVETRVLERLDVLSRQMTELNQRLTALETTGPGGGAAASQGRRSSSSRRKTNQA